MTAVLLPFLIGMVIGMVSHLLFDAFFSEDV